MNIEKQIKNKKLDKIYSSLLGASTSLLPLEFISLTKPAVSIASMSLAALL